MAGKENSRSFSQEMQESGFGDESLSSVCGDPSRDSEPRMALATSTPNRRSTHPSGDDMDIAPVLRQLPSRMTSEEFRQDIQDRFNEHKRDSNEKTDKLSEKVETLEGKLDDSEEKVETLESQLKESQEKVETLGKNLEDSQEKVETLESQLEESQERIRDLESQLGGEAGLVQQFEFHRSETSESLSRLQQTQSVTEERVKATRLKLNNDSARLQQDNECVCRALTQNTNAVMDMRPDVARACVMAETNRHGIEQLDDRVNDIEITTNNLVQDANERQMGGLHQAQEVVGVDWVAGEEMEVNEENVVANPAAD